jgi:hypothetical protein
MDARTRDEVWRAVHDAVLALMMVIGLLVAFSLAEARKVGLAGTAVPVKRFGRGRSVAVRQKGRSAVGSEP